MSMDVCGAISFGAFLFIVSSHSSPDLARLTNVNSGPLSSSLFGEDVVCRGAFFKLLINREDPICI